MRRRVFFAAVTGVALGLGAPLDLDRLAALLPSAGVELPSRIGAADVAAIEEATAALRRLDFSRGGGLSRDVAVVACDRALGRSVERLAAAEPTAAGPWNAHVGPALLAARRGRAYLTLAMASGSPRHAARAVPLLEEAVHMGLVQSRGRAQNLANLAGARAIAGDLDAAVHLGGQAVTEITALSSRRALDRLRTLDTVLQGHDAEAPVAELREQIRGALTTARA